MNSVLVLYREKKLNFCHGVAAALLYDLYCLQLAVLRKK